MGGLNMEFEPWVDPVGERAETESECED
jgi:hypothetical protein